MSQSSVCEVPDAEETLQNMGCPSRVALHWPGPKSRRRQAISRPSNPCGGLEPFDKYFKITCVLFFFFFFHFFSFSFHYHSHSGEPRQTDESDYSATGCGQERKGCVSGVGWLLQQGRQHRFHRTGGKTFQSRGMFPKLGYEGLITCMGT